jgi:hypothetical protein
MLFFHVVPTTIAARPYIRQIGAVPKGETSVTPMVGIGADGAELGVKGGYRLSDNGFVPVINNSVSIEGACFLSEIGDGTMLAIAPLLRWDFHLHPQWTAYASGGLEVRFATGGDRDDNRRSSGSRVDIAGGGVWHMNPDFDLRGEVDLAHDSLRAGVEFRF